MRRGWWLTLALLAALLVFAGLALAQETTPEPTPPTLTPTDTPTPPPTATPTPAAFQRLRLTSICSGRDYSYPGDARFRWTNSRMHEFFTTNGW